MEVAVGTRNVLKVKAVKDVFKVVFGEVRVIMVDVKSKKQPIGLEEIIQGAVSRARQAIDKTNAEYGVGIEAGIYDVPCVESYMDVQFCAIIDRRRRLTLGHSPGFMYPKEVVEKVMDGYEVEEIMEKISGIEKIGEKIGSIGYLSHNITNRLEVTRFAVLMALIPYISKELYML